MSVATVAQPRTRPSVAVRSTAGVKVLIADDSKASCAMLQDALEEAGYETCAINSAIGLEAAIASYHPQLLILSNWLPAGDSLDVLSNVRSKDTTSRLPVIVTLGSDSLSDSIAALEAGATDCLFKPLDRIEILARVHRALQQTEEPKQSEELTLEVPSQPSQPAIDTLVEMGQLDEILDALEDEFRVRASVELRRPVGELLKLSREIAASHGANDRQATLHVLRTFLSAARRLTAGSTESRSDLSRVLARGLRLDSRDHSTSQPHVGFHRVSDIKSTNESSFLK